MPSSRNRAAEFRRAQQRYQRSRKVETQYARHLRDVAHQIDAIVRGFVGKDEPPENLGPLNEALQKYSDMLRPWAQNVAERMVAEIDRRDRTMWEETGRLIGRTLSQEIASASTGIELKRFLEENVELITSLPIEAARRVHHVTTTGLAQSVRAKEIAADILKTGEVTRSRAILIARTEIARTASGLTMARSDSIGSTHYIWRTAGDSDVRPGHKAMNGKVCAWADPPAVDEGSPGNPRIMHHHAGMIWNCRCYPEPILPEE